MDVGKLTGAEGLAGNDCRSGAETRLVAGGTCNNGIRLGIPLVKLALFVVICAAPVGVLGSGVDSWSRSDGRGRIEDPPAGGFNDEIVEERVRRSPRSSPAAAGIEE